VLVIVLALVAGACSSSSSSSASTTTTGATATTGATSTTAPASTTTAGAATTAASSSTTAPTSSAKAAFLAKANAICKTMNDQLAQQGDPGTDPAALAQALDEAASVTADALRQLRALPIPPGDDAKLQAIYSKIDALLHDASQMSAALRAGDQKAAQQANQAVAADSDAANKLSNAYGLTTCGS